MCRSELSLQIMYRYISDKNMSAVKKDARIKFHLTDCIYSGLVIPYSILSNYITKKHFLSHIPPAQTFPFDLVILPVVCNILFHVSIHLCQVWSQSIHRCESEERGTIWYRKIHWKQTAMVIPIFPFKTMFVLKAWGISITSTR